MIVALITSIKSPKVTMVTGSANMTKMGFKIVFNKPKTSATIIEVRNEATVIPDMKWSRMSTIIALIKMRMRKFMVKI